MSNIVRWNPFRELAAMQSAMDRMFDETWRDVRPYMSQNNLAVDVHEDENSYIVTADVPGVNPDNIDVTLHDNVLTISVEIHQPEIEEGRRVHVQERFYGQLTRRFSLPQPVDNENVEATYDSGVLTLTLPKTEEAKPRQIKIKNAGLIRSQN